MAEKPALVGRLSMPSPTELNLPSQLAWRIRVAACDLHYVKSFRPRPRMKQCCGATKPFLRRREDTPKRRTDINCLIKQRGVIDVEASHLALPRILPALPPALPGKGD
jgi:hypothetical protein